jgi:hypothetical protein
MIQFLGRLAGSKLVTLGTGVALGVAAAPYLKKLAKDFRPELDEALDSLVGKAESIYENASDVIASAKEKLNSEENTHDGCDHDHSDEDKDHSHTH